MESGIWHMGAEMDQAKPASEADEENDSGDSSGESPESAAERGGRDIRGGEQRKHGDERAQKTTECGIYIE
jgi:hypothetical protein